MIDTKLILLVDDDDDDKQFFSEALKEVNPEAKLHLAADGFEALDYLKKTKQHPDYIFLDLNMPRMNGKQCLAEIKKNKELSGIPVIIYSTSKTEQDEKETASLGASFFLKKPYEFEEICQGISFVLSSEFSKITEKIS